MNGVFLKLSVLQFLGNLYIHHILKHIALQVYSFVHYLALFLNVWIRFYLFLLSITNCQQ